MLGVSSSKVTGIPGPSGWVQVHEFQPSDEEKLKIRGHLFAVIATNRFEEGVESVMAGRELIARFQEEYFGDLSIKPFNALKNATEKVIAEFAGNFGNIEIAACSIVKDVVYSAAGGGAEVLIYRGGMLAPILDSKEGRVISASGFPKEGDSIILGTKSFFGKISGGIIKGALENKSPEDSVEAFAPLVHGNEFSGNMGAVIVKFSENPTLENLVAAPQIATTTENKLLDRAGDIKTKTVGFLSNFLRKIPERKIYVQPGEINDAFSKSKKLSFTVAVILLALLGVSIVFGIRQNRINKVKSSYIGKLAEADNDLNQAISVSGVDISRSRDLFRTSEDLLNQIKALNVKDPKIDELAQKIASQKGTILGEFDDDPQLFWDLSLLSSGFKGDKISESGGNVYILDKSGKKIAGVEISTKKSSIVANPDKITDARDLTSYTDSVFVLDSDGVYEVDGPRNRVIDKTWSGDAFVQAYTGNMYVLDKNGNAIYRYAGSGGAFSDKQNWLSSDTKPDFSGSVGWAIDGSIYVLYPNSKILKFSLGSPQNFSISGIDVVGIDSIFASDDTSGIYLLDKTEKKVVVLDKNGNYKAQYVSDKISEASGLAVSETDKKIILLTGGKLLSLDIKHLQ